MEVHIIGTHNHPTDGMFGARHRTFNSQVKQELADLFQKKFTIAQAREHMFLKAHSMGVLFDRYHEFVFDSSQVPSYEQVR